MSWFHQKISGLDAENLLKTRGTDGSFLVRHSKSVPGNFTLSIRTKDVITHIKIQNTGDHYDLYGGEKFATLTELIQYHLETPGQLKVRNGNVIDLKYPLLSSAPITERWFHGLISGREAEELIEKRCKNGGFLVRESQSKPGDYVLTVKIDDEVAHIMINRENNLYDIMGIGETFKSLAELIGNYRKKPLVITTGKVIRLNVPFNATRVSADQLEKRIVQLEQDRNGHNGFWEEFEELQLQDTMTSYKRFEGSKAESRMKNRFKNILPFDHTRVKLMDGQGSDYINANYLKLESDKCYIATQGPLPTTIIDFWRMIWQENTRIIVMTTKEMERSKNKCSQYWPNEDETETYGVLTVKNVAVNTNPFYKIRELLLTNTTCDESRTVFHYHFLSWPDFGVPSDPSTVLDFLDKVNDIQDELILNDQAGPMVVHCSAGIGRTGALIVIDSVISLIKRQSIHCEIDIYKMVETIRSQRSGMIQTDSQYAFIYRAIASYVQSVEQLQRQQFKTKKSGRDYTNVRYSTEISNLFPKTPQSNQFIHRFVAEEHL